MQKIIKLETNRKKTPDEAWVDVLESLVKFSTSCTEHADSDALYVKMLSLNISTAEVLTKIENEIAKMSTMDALCGKDGRIK